MDIMSEIITETSAHPIQPEDVNATKRFFGAFDNMETEISAAWLVRFARDRGKGWAAFTRKDIEEYYGRWQQDGFAFNRLVIPEAVLADPAKEFGRMAEHASMTRGMHPAAAAISYTMHRSKPETVERGGGLIVLKDGMYYFTRDFIARCYRSSPII